MVSDHAVSLQELDSKMFGWPEEKILRLDKSISNGSTNINIKIEKLQQLG